MTDRLRPIPPEDWTDAQRAAAQEIINGPRGALYGPFVPLLRSPELMGYAQRVGEYLRYRSAIGVRLSELAILVTAREWDQQVEWAIHAPIAQQVGVPPDVIDAIARRVPKMCPKLQSPRGRSHSALRIIPSSESAIIRSRSAVRC